MLKGEGLETSIVFKAYSFILCQCLCIHASKQPMFNIGAPPRGGNYLLKKSGTSECSITFNLLPKKPLDYMHYKTFFSRLNEPPKFTTSEVTLFAIQLHHQSVFIIRFTDWLDALLIIQFSFLKLFFR